MAGPPPQQAQPPPPPPPSQSRTLTKAARSDVVYTVYADMKASDEKTKYLGDLKRELAQVDASFSYSHRLLEHEIARIEDGRASPSDHIPVHRDRLVKLFAKVRVPSSQYPHINFTARILGPNGANLRDLCQATKCKIGLFGRGSLGDAAKEAELRKANSLEHDHLKEPLHLYLETIAFPAEAFARIAHGLHESRKFVDPFYSGIESAQDAPFDPTADENGAGRWPMEANGADAGGDMQHQRHQHRGYYDQHDGGRREGSSHRYYADERRSNRSDDYGDHHRYHHRQPSREDLLPPRGRYSDRERGGARSPRDESPPPPPPPYWRQPDRSRQQWQGHDRR